MMALVPIKNANFLVPIANESEIIQSLILFSAHFISFLRLFADKK
jgi:hypothetical protein